ncbi:MAG: elongation factor P [Candidatus Omnitrophota bacterium]
MPISINELKSGLTVLINGQIFTVIDYQHVKPGKGAAFVRTKLRNLKTAAVLDRTFKGDEKIEEAFIEEKKIQFQYKADTIYHFMNQETFEEVIISEGILGPNYKFLKDNLELKAYSYKGEIINIALPVFIEFKIIHTEPGIKGDTAKSSYKSATIQTGANIQVPLFIETGDVIKVDSRTGEYIERV